MFCLRFDVERDEDNIHVPVLLVSRSDFRMCVVVVVVVVGNATPNTNGKHARKTCVTNGTGRSIGLYRYVE